MWNNMFGHLQNCEIFANHSTQQIYIIIEKDLWNNRSLRSKEGQPFSNKLSNIVFLSLLNSKNTYTNLLIQTLEQKSMLGNVRHHRWMVVSASILGLVIFCPHSHPYVLLIFTILLLEQIGRKDRFTIFTIKGKCVEKIY